jgi:hypothetical protein
MYVIQFCLSWGLASQCNSESFLFWGGAGCWMDGNLSTTCVWNIEGVWGSISRERGCTVGWVLSAGTIR